MTRVLVIEDDPDDFYLLANMLKSDSRKRYQILHRESLDDAFKVLEDNQFDIILLDLGLGETVGLETLSKVTNSDHQVPIIVFTGVNNEHVGEKAIKMGAEDYIPKDEANTLVLNRAITYAIERHSLIKQLHERALTDTLTGLPNRLALFERLNTLIQNFERSQCRLAAAMLDLDGFKSINDNFGHSVGDEVLKIMGKRLQEELRISDTVARLGGDEFVIIFSNFNDLSDIQAVLHKKQKILTNAIDIQNGNTINTYNVGISVGLAEWQSEESAEMLLSNADKAMYKSKRNGKNQISVFETE